MEAYKFQIIFSNQRFLLSVYFRQFSAWHNAFHFKVHNFAYFGTSRNRDLFYDKIMSKEGKVSVIWTAFHDKAFEPEKWCSLENGRWYYLYQSHCSVTDLY